MDRTYIAREGEEECIQGFRRKTRRKETTRKEDLDVVGRIILKLILEK
jgi:hypothetical protein